jgi:hypothetical protein
MKHKSAKTRVLKHLKDAFCVRLDNGSGYIVWPGKTQPRGCEQPAIGLGKSAQKAWKSVKLKELKP